MFLFCFVFNSVKFFNPVFELAGDNALGSTSAKTHSKTQSFRVGTPLPQLTRNTSASNETAFNGCSLSLFPCASGQPFTAPATCLRGAGYLSPISKDTSFLGCQRSAGMAGISLLEFCLM